MVLSDVSIRRPVFATVISLILLVVGVAALMRLPIREYPAIDPPVVSINTVYRGASNEVIENRVTEPLESSVAGIEGVKQITAVSTEERSTITIEFDVSRDVDSASADVRDRVSRVLGRLPEGVDAPVIAKVDSNAQAIMWIGVSSSTQDALELSDFLRRNVVNRLATVPGVATVLVGGERRYAMRIAIDRQALAARGLTAQDIEQAIRRQNVELPGGRLTSTQRELTVKADTRLSTPDSFAQVVVANRNGYLVRLGEVARVEVGAEDERFEYYQDGKTTIGLGVTRQSTANTLAVAQGIRAEMARLEPAFPPGTSYRVLYDESAFIEASIRGVLTVLAEGVGLVILIILLFLRSWRSTVIAAIAIPVSVVASFAVLAAFGFSINVLTLLAMVLAIGIVVDDAIVVIENIYRRIELGEPPLLAAFNGAREIGFAVIATTLTLMAVFIPISFLDGRTGRLFSEFGIALAAAIGFSGLVALTLTPMMSSKLLSHEHGLVHRKTEPFFVALNDGYRWLLGRTLAAPLVVLFAGALVSLAAWQLWATVPKEFAPVEDRGVIFVPIAAPEGASAAYTRERIGEIEAMLKRFRDSGDVVATLAIVAPGLQRPAPVNRGLLILRLEHWDERTVRQQDIHRQMIGPVGALPGARAFPINPPSLGQRGFQQPIQFVIGGPDFDTLRGWRDRVIQRAQQTGQFVNLDSDYREAQPDLRVRIDRARAADLGVEVETVGRTLELMFGEREISNFVVRGEEYPVIVRARAEDRVGPSDLSNVFVRGRSGELVAISSFVTLQEAAGPQDLNRVDRLRAITIQGSMAPGVTLAQALATLENIAAEALPAEARIGYSGQSKEFKESSSALYVTFGLALLVVFLVLAAQFESFVHPAIIMLTVPLAITGGLGALHLTGQTLNVYSQIGMILLIGLMTKNGILIVEFANQLRERGASVVEAVTDASVTRLRPILMTSIATVCGAVPLAVSSGAGAEARAAIGWVIIGGVSLSTVLTLFVVPAIYALVAGSTQPANAVSEALDRLRGGPQDKAGDASAAPAE